MEENNQVVKNGPGALRIVGFILSFIVAPAGLVLSIIGLAKKDGRSKGLSIAGLIISIFNLLIQLIAVLILVGIMAPQVIKYIEKTNVSSDFQYADSIKTALITVAMDPDVNSGYIPYCTDFQDIEDIPEGPFRDAFEDLMGTRIEDLTNHIRSHHSEDAQILYVLDYNHCSVMITTTDETGHKGSQTENYIMVR